MDCSATGFLSAVWRVAALASLFAGSALEAHAATVAELADAQARVQYAFLTADARALEGVLAEIAQYDTDARWQATKSYQLAHGYWKLAQVYARQARNNSGTKSAASLASAAAKRCVEHARAARAHDPRLAEAFALEAVCDGMPRAYLAAEGLTGSCARSKPLRAALDLEPNNPRIRLIEAMCAGAGDASVVARWQRVVAAFAAAPPALAGQPDWGEPEALAMLGAQLIRQGDTLAARDALERALVLAPDYHAARELLEAVSQRAR
jgi:hypothetical protein